MRLIAFRTAERPAAIRPGVTRRQWMDETPRRYAYKCLPLTIANQHGWDLLCPCAFDVLWTGGDDPAAIQIVRLSGGDAPLPFSHFGSGVITFKPGYLFRTEDPYDLFVGGPPNVRKDGIAPLTGIVETSWLPFTFTMNWICTRVGVAVRFEEDEPFCRVFPVTRHLVENVEPVLCELAEDPDLSGQYREWKGLRAAYFEDSARDGTARVRGRDPYYIRGTLANGQPTTAEHLTRLRVKPFAPTAAAQARQVGFADGSGGGDRQP